MASTRHLYTIGFDAFDRIFPFKVDCKRLSISVIYIHYAQAFGICRIDHAVVKVDGGGSFPVLVINIYDLTGRIKGAVVKRIFRTCPSPQGITYVLYLGCLCTGSVEGNIFKCSRFISPVVSTSIESAIF